MILLRALPLVAVVALAGCVQPAVRSVVAGQTPGVASGAGATLTGPANSATPTTQVAWRQIAYQPLARPQMASAAPQLGTVEVNAPTMQPPPLASPVAPAWVYEHTETTLGQHQDVAGIVKVAAKMSGWSTVKWIGALCVLLCVGGLLWSHGNPDGYPVVFWKVGGVGVFLLLVGDNPFWLLLLLIPLGFYVLQKLNLLRIP